MPGPHDLLARYVFSHPERAAAELRAILPPRIVEQVDWTSLRGEPVSVVDEELRETENDFLFSARLHSGEPALMYVLLEHQSKVERFMALRMFRYVGRVLDTWQKKHPRRELLPAVFSQVLYHGPGGRWTAPQRLEDLFELPKSAEERERWLKLLPRFEYLLDDLTVEREEALLARKGPPLAKLAFVILPYGRAEGLEERLRRWKRLFMEVATERDGVEAVRAVVQYLLTVGSEEGRQALRDIVRSVLNSHQAEETMRTMAEAWRDEGRAEGEAKGRAEGEAKAILQVLSLRGVSVSESLRQQILGCTDITTLDVWLQRALTATSPSDVIADV
jgi:predicted transposase/invertase (TIGR01784 family)